MRWRIIPQKSRGELVNSKAIRFVPTGIDANGEQQFASMKPPVVKVLLQHEASDKVVTVTRKGKTFTVTNPDRVVLKRLPNGKYPWNPEHITVPGEQTKHYDFEVFFRYIKERFGEGIAMSVSRSLAPEYYSWHSTDH